MKSETRQKFNEYCAFVAESNQYNGQPVEVSKKFTIQTPVMQTYQDIMREEVGFLQLINMETVELQESETIGLDIGTTIAGVTDTTIVGNERQPAQVHKHEKLNRYRCEQVNFDTLLRYPTLDKWSGHDDFIERYGRALTKQMARDHVMIGWNGKERAANTSDRKNNPMLEDVAVGWLEKIRRNAPERIQTDPVTLGDEGDYKNIDALVFDLVENKMAEHHREDTDLVVIIGRKLFHNKYLGLLNDSTLPSERVNANVLWGSREIAGMRCLRVPYFPDDAVLVTRLDNLSIYTQDGSMRRTIIDNAKSDQVEEYTSKNIDFVVEDYTGLAMSDAGVIKVV